MKSVAAVLIWTILRNATVSLKHSHRALFYFCDCMENKQVTAVYNWQQNDHFSWNQISDMDVEPHTKIRAAESPKSADSPFHVVFSFFQPIFSAFHSSAPKLNKASVNETNLPVHGKYKNLTSYGIFFFVAQLFLTMALEI
jgi:hypothetical protein